MKEPKLITGGIAVDDRGQLTFANDFNFKDVKRFYMVENHQPQFVRGWHGHKIESKYVMVVSGAIKIGAVPIKKWDYPNKAEPVHDFVLSSASPKILYIPSGYANGFMTLVPYTRVMFFSTTTLEESKNDDYRYPADYWNIWNVECR